LIRIFKLSPDAHITGCPLYTGLNSRDFAVENFPCIGMYFGFDMLTD